MLDAMYDAEVDDWDHRAGETMLRPSVSQTRATGVVDEDIPRLVQRFIEHVHLKNPVVDVDTLWLCVQRVAEEGIDWTPASCLVVCVPRLQEFESL